MACNLIINKKGTDDYLVDGYQTEEAAKSALQDLLKQIADAGTNKSKVIVTKSGMVALPISEFASAKIYRSGG